MVKENELKIGETYYVSGYSGAEKVTLLAIDGEFAEVKTKKSKSFYRKLKYLFQDADAAKKARREWESGRRKSKKK